MKRTHKIALFLFLMFVAVNVVVWSQQKTTISKSGNDAAVKAASVGAAATDPALVVTLSPNSYQFSCVDRSGSIATGGTAQAAASLNAGRQNITLQNYSSATSQGIAVAESLFYSFTGPATVTAGVPASGVFELTPGQSITFGAVVTTQALSVNAVTTGHKWASCEQ